MAGHALDGCTVQYFPFPGRGDAVRLALELGGVDYTDKGVPFSDWSAVKPTTPFGSLPTLALKDGTVLTQQRALLRFVGKQTGLYPPESEPVLQARVDELMDATEDLVGKTFAAGKGLEKAAMEAARAEATTTGPTAQLLGRIDEYIAAHGSGGCAVGGTMTVADLFLWGVTSMIVSGVYDGVPTTVMEPFPSIQGVRRAVRSSPKVAAYYDRTTPESAAYAKL